jgi:hypothetical protein
VTFELVEESGERSVEEVFLELREWLQENAFTIPWVREVKNITIKED